MLLSLGSQSLILPKRSACRRELLLLLERDLYGLSLLFCPECIALHPPELSWTIGRNAEYRQTFGDSRPCVQRHQRLRPNWEPSPWLPENINYERIRVAIAQHESNVRYPDDYLPLLRNRSSYRGFAEPGCSRPEIRHSGEFVVSGGRIVLCACTKLKTCGSLFTGGWINAEKSTFLFLLGRTADLSHCCAHMTWQRKYPFLFNPGLIETPESASFQANVQLSNMQVKVFGRMETCNFCHTSYTYCVLNGGMQVDLVSYKGLGEGKTTTDPRWQSHQWYGSEIPLQNISQHRLAIVPGLGSEWTQF
ncbi:hypothetical protein CKAH01_14468 [Colletotrichum kahawae]|uniref:Uncharacterized protein n=1 Tax=Colletotrichum kahawae TaxID=34407 RepID=A0AAD9YLS9_COLKA|nr:hypothetical protein CKAH01_14468 [Colletotrichum kahawae]